MTATTPAYPMANWLDHAAKAPTARRPRHWAGCRWVMQLAGEDWAECVACGHRDALRKMSQVRNEHDQLEWRCDDCSRSEETTE